MNLFLKRIKRRFIFKDKLKMTPTVFLSLFLVFTMTLLTGMCTIFPKKKVLIYDEGEKIGSIHSTNKENLNSCVKEYLKTIGKEIKQKDVTKIEKLSNGNYEFKIKRAIKINLKLFGKEKVVYLKQNQTVKDLLKEFDVDTTNSKVHITPSLETVLKENDTVIVQNCEVEIKNENFEFIDLPEEQVEDSKLEQGKTVVKVNPVPRKVKKFVECKYVDGVLVEQKQKEEIVEKGVAKKIAVGKKQEAKKTENKKLEDKKQEAKKLEAKKKEPKKQPVAKKKEPKKLEAKNKEANPPLEAKPDTTGKRVLCGYSTAYVAKGRTARLGPAKFGVVAVNPKVIPYGTKLFIEGYGTCVAGDMCGAACRGKVLVDVCFKTKEQCRAWGKRKVKIHIL